jgi:magnesium chelatase accessory protein
MGARSADVMLLLHGTGASHHSWAALMPALAQHYHVIAIDLPGHGFTQTPADTYMYSLPGMSEAVHALMNVLAVKVTHVVGHSAGAAVAVWMCLEKLCTPRQITGINGALLPLQGAAAHIFSPAARLLWHTRVAPGLFAWSAQQPWVVRQLLHTTGSTISAQSRMLYAELLRNPSHVGAALPMMAHWDLPQLMQRLSHLTTPLTLLAGGCDRAVPPHDAQRVAHYVPHTNVIQLPSLGHLAHEEAPAAVLPCLLPAQATV